MKKFIPYGTIVMICVFILVAWALPLKAANINQGRCLVLGDSVASGYGLTENGEKAEDVSWAALLAKKYVAEVCNCAVDYYTTSDLLLDVKKTGRQEMITSSDVICISIGGNNLIQLFYGNVEKSVTKAEIDTVVAAMIDAASDDLDEIFNIIKEKNSDALVMVQTLYNPFMYCETNASQYISGYQGTVGELVEEYIDDYNQMLRQKTQEQGFTCVEVAQQFQMEGKASWVNTKTDSLDLVFNGLNRIEGASASIAGVSVEPSANGATFQVNTMTDSQGQKYKAIKNITKSGLAKLKVSATGNRWFWNTTAGLSPNASYTVTLNIECDGKGDEPVFYEQSNGVNEFIIRHSGGKISFVVETDKYGAFTQEWSTIYVNSGVSTSIKFTDVTITKNIDFDLSPTKEGHYAIYDAYLDAGMDDELKEKLGILMDVSDYRRGDTYTYPNLEGYVFAGWYQDAQFNKPISTTTKTGNAYAKFVDDDVLSVKYQLKSDTLETSEKTDLRIVTTVDSLRYSSVGFVIGLENRGKMTRLTSTVYETIYAYADGQQVVYQPKFFSPDSKYFMSYLIQGVTKDFFDSGFTVTPIWITQDGTTVSGANREFTVLDKLSKMRTVNVNYRDVIRLTEYFEEGDNFSNAKLYSPAGKQITIGDGCLFADTMGTYTLVLPESVYTYHFVVEDIEGPVVMLNGQKTVVDQGETIIIQPRIVDNVDGEINIQVDDLSYTVKKKGQTISVQNHSFIAEGWGTYVIEFALQDTAGNQAAPVTIEIANTPPDINDGQIVTGEDSVYGSGITVVPERIENGELSSLFEITEKTVAEGENVGKKYNGIGKIIQEGWAKLTVNADQTAGLQTNTEYLVTLNVVCDGENPAFFEQHEGDSDFILASPGGIIRFTITTDANGTFKKEWRTVWLNQSLGLTYVDFVGIEIIKVPQIVTGEDSVYGEGITVVPERIENGTSSALFEMTEKEMYAGTNGGKKYNGIGNITQDGWAKLTVNADQTAGLKANTEYAVTVDVVCDGNYPAFYEQHEGGNDFILDSAGGEICFTITTDENGTFKKEWTTIYLNKSNGLTYVNFIGVKIVENADAPIVSGVDSVYGEGISVITSELDGGAGFVRTEKAVAEGANAGKKYNGIGNITQEGWASLTVKVEQNAGLKPNTEYKITIDVLLDGNYPAFFEQHEGGNDFVLGAPNGQITFIIVTDANGTFEKVWDTIYLNKSNGLTYADFANITISEVSDSVYGPGVTIVPGRLTDGWCATFETTEKTVAEGTNAGKKYVGITNFNAGYSTLTISANEEAQLKANTTYNVCVDVICDGAEGLLAYHDDTSDPNNPFILYGPGGKINFTITTDSEGRFTQEWSQVVMNDASAWTYLDFTNITFSEVSNSVYGLGVSIVPGRLTDGWCATFETTEKTVAEGANVGKKYVGITNFTAGYSTLTISANEEAQLKANTTYEVSVDVVCDGADGLLAYHDDSSDSNNPFILYGPGGKINFTITTDSEGRFTQEWSQVVMNDASGWTYLEFTNITFGEM